jgi:hypothetical protein
MAAYEPSMNYRASHSKQSPCVIPSLTADTVTPQITVIGDSQHTRTIFPCLPGITEQLELVDLAPLEGASFAYVDCYVLIERAAARPDLSSTLKTR